jgi:GT2 family glycosyltransferase
MNLELSIIIVNYNTCQLTIDALKSVYDSETKYTYEVILVDNHSSDNSVATIRAAYPHIPLIENEGNLGFSKANNQGIRRAKGRYILLLNSDTLLEPDTLQTMIQFMDDHPQAGASGCKLVLTDGSLDKACKRGFPTPSAAFYYITGLSRLFPDNPKFNQYQLGHLSDNEHHQVDSLVGAFMLVRRATIDQVGLLDENYYMYGEDVDWCYRMKEAGWEIHYYPKTKITHLKGASSRRKPMKIICEFYRAMYLFHHKHYRKQYIWVVNAIIYAGITLSFIGAVLKNKLFGRMRSS